MYFWCFIVSESGGESPRTNTDSSFQEKLLQDCKRNEGLNFISKGFILGIIFRDYNRRFLERIPNL